MKMTLESNSLFVIFEEQTKQFVITDKRIGKVWKQAPFGADCQVTNAEVRSKENKLILNLKGTIDMTLSVALENETELLYTLSADPEEVIDEIAFPPAIQAPDSRHYVLQTDSEGILLPVDDCGYPLEQQPMFRCSGGPGMAWIGMVDYDLEAGFMNIYETPYDADIKMHKVDGLICFSVVWQSSMRKFSYDRKIRTVFFDKGGYVAQCKRYRSYAWVKNDVKPLRQKMERFPAIEKMLGSVHVYVWGDARTKEFIEEMHECGINRALILWDSNHVPYPDADFTPAVTAAGYGTGKYDLFTDIHMDTPERLETLKKLPLLESIYPGKFEYLTAKTKDGGTYSNRFGTYICPAAVKEEIIRCIDRIFEDYPEETMFLDVYQANGLYECYDERHPVTREGYAKNINDNFALIEDTYGMYMGSEFGADYAAGHGTYVHGMMTLQRTWFDSEPTIPGSIYYIGDWRINSDPTIMVGTRTANDTYHKYSLNVYTRVPLYELVYHDAVVTSWRWEDGNHHYPEIWWKKDLYNVLYGNSPLWSINRDRFEAYKTTFSESYQKVIPWIKQVCLDEMVDHRFLTADHTVQQTVYSSGKSVVVNFGDKEYDYEGTIIPARDYVAFTE